MDFAGFLGHLAAVFGVVWIGFLAGGVTHWLGGWRAERRIFSGCVVAGSARLIWGWDECRVLIGSCPRPALIPRIDPGARGRDAEAASAKTAQRGARHLQQSWDAGP